ncbi:MAG: ABC transporter permease [Christensenellales bacterium]
MLNTLRMDIRRLLRARSLYVGMLIIALIVGIATTAIHFLTTQSVDDLAQMGAWHEDGDDMQSKLAMAARISPENAKNAMLELRRQADVQSLSMVPIQQIGMAHLMLVIVVALFAAKDYATGYLKNLLTLRGIKSKWLLSKLVIALLVSALLYLTTLLSAVIGSLLLGNPAAFDAAKLLSFFGVHMAVDLALAASVLCVLTLTQNKTAALVFGMLEAFNFQRMIFFLLDTLGWLPFRLSDYAMMNQAGKYAPGGPAGQLLITAGVLFAVYALGAWGALVKRDLKM